jgi:hypothetical protein
MDFSKGRDFLEVSFLDRPGDDLLLPSLLLDNDFSLLLLSLELRLLPSLLLDKGFSLLLLSLDLRLLVSLLLENGFGLLLRLTSDLDLPISPFDESCESRFFLASRSLSPSLAMKADFVLSKLALFESCEGCFFFASRSKSTSLSSTVDMFRMVRSKPPPFDAHPASTAPAPPLRESDAPLLEESRESRFEEPPPPSHPLIGIGLKRAAEPPLLDEPWESLLG